MQIPQVETMRGPDIPHSDTLFAVTAAGKTVLSSAATGSVKWITTQDFDLHYVTRGQGRLTINEKVYPLVRGDILMVFPGERFLVGTDHDIFERFYFHFEMVSCKAIATDSSGPPVFPFRQIHLEEDSGATRLCTRIVREFHSDMACSRSLSTAYFTELMVGFLRQTHTGRRARLPENVRKNFARLLRAKALVETHVADRLTLIDIAEESGLSVDYFSKLFKTLTGHTPCEYHMRCKIDQARDFLIENEMSISEIAYALGFDDVHYFSRVFKKWTRLSPTEYATRILADESV